VPFQIKRMIAPTCQCHGEDVTHLKAALRKLGYLEDTELNRSSIPYQDMFDALKKFQDDYGIEESVI